MAKQQEKKVLMNFQKQANYRAKKKKKDAKKVTKKKEARKERDRLRYLKKKGMGLQQKQGKLKVKEQQLQKNKEAILRDLYTLGKSQERMEKQLAEVNKGAMIISNKMFKKKNKK